MKRPYLVAAVPVLLLTGAAHAQQTPMLGQIMPTAFQFCPAGWVEADGQIMNIAQNTALFALFGTTYGGNGQTTFAIPDLRGRVAAHTGLGKGLASTPQGEVTGEAATTLTVDQMPVHNHAFNASPSPPNVKPVAGAALATFPAASTAYATTAPVVPMVAESTAMAGESKPFDQYQPSLVLRYCVAVTGDFPKRN
ncbi:MAG: tail fiber protein [Alphaproteobacteria bacterium]|nr:tail fiber protein [Alphaproteobacteria bacterium]